MDLEDVPIGWGVMRPLPVRPAAPPQPQPRDEVLHQQAAELFRYGRVRRGAERNTAAARLMVLDALVAEMEAEGS